MKKSKIAFAALLLGTLLLSSCIKDPFTKIVMNGDDRVVTDHGREQKVVVTGHAAMIGRIRTHVWNGLRTMELEHDNYGHFGMTYYVTQPAIDKVTKNDMLPADSCTVEIGLPVRQAKENGILQFN